MQDGCDTTSAAALPHAQALDAFAAAPSLGGWDDESAEAMRRLCPVR